VHAKKGVKTADGLEEKKPIKNRRSCLDEPTIGKTFGRYHTWTKNKEGVGNSPFRGTSYTSEGLAIIVSAEKGAERRKTIERAFWVECPQGGRSGVPKPDGDENK